MNFDILSRVFGKVGGLLLPGNVVVMTGSGAPVDGTTGAGYAGKGSFYIRYGTGAVFVNTNTKASPTWTQLGSVAALADGNIFVGNAGGAAAAVVPSGDVTITNAGVTAIGADKVLSAMVSEKLIKYAEVAISSADIVATTAGKLGHAQGYPLVAAPAAGKALELISATLIYDYAGAGYGAGGNISVNWAGGGAAITGVVSAANSLGAGADKVVQLLPLATAGNALSVATGINLVAASAFTLGSATGVVRVKVAYRLHTTELA